MASKQAALGRRKSSISMCWSERSWWLSRRSQRVAILRWPRSVSSRLDNGSGHSLVGSLESMMLSSCSRLLISYSSHFEIASSTLSSFPIAMPSSARNDLSECPSLLCWCRLCWCGVCLFKEWCCGLVKSSTMACRSALLLVVRECVLGTLMVLKMLNSGSVPMEGVRCFLWSRRVRNLALGHTFSLELKGVELQLLLLVCFI